MFLPLKDHNPTRTTPYVTIALIALNSLVFLVELGQGPQLAQFLGHWGAVPYQLLHGNSAITFTGTPTMTPGPSPVWITAITSMFLHGGFFHIIFNMLYLWIFGNNVEDFLGHFRYLLFYLGCGLAGLFAHVLLHPNATLPVIGASGAISGVLGAYMLLYPRARVTTLVFLIIFVTFIQVPALVLLGFWILIQLLSGLGSLGKEGGGTAHWAHIGGFVAGYLYLRLGPGRQVLARRRKESKWAASAAGPPQTGPAENGPVKNGPVENGPPPPPRVGPFHSGDPISRFLQEIEEDATDEDDHRP